LAAITGHALALGDLGYLNNPIPQSRLQESCPIFRDRAAKVRGQTAARIGRFEACSTFTGYYGLSVRRFAKRPVCLEGSDGFVSSPRRFDS